MRTPGWPMWKAKWLLLRWETISEQTRFLPQNTCANGTGMLIRKKWRQQIKRGQSCYCRCIDMAKRLCNVTRDLGGQAAGNPRAIHH